MIGQALEAAMLICFGLSWPLNAYKNWQARTAAGTSWQFILLITLGYVAGIAAKYISGQVNWVLIVYYLNLVFLGANWYVYFRNTRLDKQRLASAQAPVNEQAAGEPSHVLLATDGSTASLDAARYILGSLDMSQTSVDVITAVENDTPQSLELAREKASQTAQILQDKGVECQVDVQQGNAPTVIIDAADKKDADLVVMGCRGLSGLKSVVLGSVSRQVAEHSDKPVLIVK